MTQLTIIFSQNIYTTPKAKHTYVKYVLKNMSHFLGTTSFSNKLSWSNVCYFSSLYLKKESGHVDMNESE